MKLYRLYLEKAKEAIRALDNDYVFGNLDIEVKLTDIEDMKLSTCFLYKKESYGYSISVTQHSMRDPYPHILRVERFSDYDYKYECDHGNVLLQFLKKKGDTTMDIEVQELIGVYSRVWELDICNK